MYQVYRKVLPDNVISGFEFLNFIKTKKKNGMKELPSRCEEAVRNGGNFIVLAVKMYLVRLKCGENFPVINVYAREPALSADTSDTPPGKLMGSGLELSGVSVGFVFRGAGGAGVSTRFSSSRLGKWSFYVQM